ncbi:hypothetical protein DIPPA_17060, partial [Diplonema papillatum]
GRAMGCGASGDAQWSEIEKRRKSSANDVAEETKSPATKLKKYIDRERKKQEQRQNRRRKSSESGGKGVHRTRDAKDDARLHKTGDPYQVDEDDTEEEEEEEEDEEKEESKADRRERKRKLNAYRRDVILRKREEVSPDSAMRHIEALVGILTMHPLPCVVYQPDGSVLHLNAKAQTILNHDASNFQVGNLVSKFIKFPEEKVGNPPDYDTLVAVAPSAKLSPRTAPAVASNIEKELDEVAAVATTYLGIAIPVATTTYLVPLETFDVFITAIRMGTAAPGSLGSSGSMDSSLVGAALDKRLKTPPMTPHERSSPLEHGAERVSFRGKLPMPDGDSSDTGSESANSSISSFHSSLLRKPDRLRTWAHGDITITINRSGLIRGLSHGAQKLTGLQVDDVVDTPVDTLLEDTERSLSDVVTAGEVRLFKGEEDEKRFSIRCQPEGNIEVIVIVGVTEVPVEQGMLYVARFSLSSETQKKKKLAFAFKGGISEEMGAVFEHGHSLVVVSTLAGEIVYANDALLTLLRYREDEVLHEDVAIFVPFPYRVSHPESVRDVYSRISSSFFQATRDTVVISRIGKVLPVKMEVTELQTPQSKTLYVASFRIIRPADSQLADATAKLLQKCVDDPRNTDEHLAQDTRQRAEIKRLTLQKKASISRRPGRSPRGVQPTRRRSGAPGDYVKRGSIGSSNDLLPAMSSGPSGVLRSPTQAPFAITRTVRALSDQHPAVANLRNRIPVDESDIAAEVDELMSGSCNPSP